MLPMAFFSVGAREALSIDIVRSCSKSLRALLDANLLLQSGVIESESTFGFTWTGMV